MTDRLTRQISWILVVGAALFWGCGEVDLTGGLDRRLKVVYQYPSEGEKDVPTDLVVIVVFSDTVTFDNNSDASVNTDTFYVKEGSESEKVSECTVGKSSLDRLEATALLTVPSLVSGQDYWLVIEGTIRGKNTEPLGERVEYSFTVE